MRIKCKLRIPPIEYWIFVLYFMGIAYFLLYKMELGIHKNAVSQMMIMLFIVHIFAIAYDIFVLYDPIERLPAAINTALLWSLTTI